VVSFGLILVNNSICVYLHCVEIYHAKPLDTDFEPACDGVGPGVM
jgi:hypothetical protein